MFPTLQEQPKDAQTQRMHGTGPVAAQLQRNILGATVPGGEPRHEDVPDGAVLVPIQLDAAVRTRGVHRAAAGRGGVFVRAVRGHAQPAGVRVPERRVPQGDTARGVQSQQAARVAGRGQGGRWHVPPTTQADRAPAGQRVRAQFPHVFGRVPTLFRFGHAAARRLRGHVQPGKAQAAV